MQSIGMHERIDRGAFVEFLCLQINTLASEHLASGDRYLSSVFMNTCFIVYVCLMARREEGAID